MNAIVLGVFVSLLIACHGYSSKELKCLVCKVAIEEMTDAIESVNPNKKIQVGGYRLGNNGEYSGRLVPYKRSSMQISELMDTTCEKMTDYVRAKTKDTKKLVLLKLMTSEGVMNPDISNVDLIQDSDLNKSLEFYCESIMQEHEDIIHDGLRDDLDDPAHTICESITELCGKSNDEKVEL
ncbi:hypothetical protein RUM44_006440 [Polyplax serrata]|uniref:DUF3456 domain-containing protein n=1 Tax=Polyplax serrata TaxID=468196 RepID=A0ABR1AI68_POLSC